MMHTYENGGQKNFLAAASCWVLRKKEKEKKLKEFLYTLLWKEIGLLKIEIYNVF